jgi:ectoine hydroxylase-related dioxygenase (phytanoyl-CoA dioxygenase family)
MSHAFHRELADSTPLLQDEAALRARGEREGVLFLRRLIEPRAVLDLRAEVLDVCRDVRWLAEEGDPLDARAQDGVGAGDPNDPTWTAFQCKVLTLPRFKALGVHPALLAALERLAGGPVEAHAGDACRVMPPRRPDLTTRPHQDHFYLRGDARLWTAWIPLGDCPIGLGGLAVAPGSHRAGLLAHGPGFGGKAGVDVADDDVWVAGNYRCGDVVVFHSLTLHRALVNESADQLRLSADYRYRPLPR